MEEPLFHIGDYVQILRPARLSSLSVRVSAVYPKENTVYYALDFGGEPLVWISQSDLAPAAENGTRQDYQRAG
jgi:hypothetical protein